MNCNYCYVKKTNTSFNVEDIKINIDNCLQIIKSNSVTIEFMGGEPLMEIDLIIDICEYVKNKYQTLNIQFLLITNGTYYSKKIINVIKKYNIRVIISIDGSEYFHNLNRKFNNGNDSWKTVYSNSLSFLKDIPNNVGASITLTAINVDYLCEAILNLYNMGFKNINFTYYNPEVKPRFLKEYYNQLIKYYENYNFNDLKLIVIEDIKRKTTSYYNEKGQLIAEIKKTKKELSKIDSINILIYNKFVKKSF